MFAAISGLLGKLTSSFIGRSLMSAAGNALMTRFARPKQRVGVDFAKLRSDAEAAGFNPYVAMRSGALGMYGFQPEYSPFSFFGNLAGGFLSSLGSFDPVQGELNRTSLDIARLERDTFMQRFAPGFGNQGFDYASAGPFIPVKRPDGVDIMLETTMARRLSILPGDTLMAGEWQELKGEVLGEAEVFAAGFGGQLAKAIGFGSGSFSRGVTASKLPPPDMTQVIPSVPPGPFSSDNLGSLMGRFREVFGDVEWPVGSPTFSGQMGF